MVPFPPPPPSGITVPAVVAARSVDAQPHLAAARQQLDDTRRAAAQPHVRARAMRDAGLGFHKSGEVRVIEVYAMRQVHITAQPAAVAQVGYRPLAEFLNAIAFLAAALALMIFPMPSRQFIM